MSIIDETPEAYYVYATDDMPEVVVRSADRER